MSNQKHSSRIRLAKASRFLLGNLKRYSMLIALLIIGLIFQIETKGVLLVPMNVSNLIAQNAYVVILAVGMLICILTGGNIDLSVGSVVALVGACAGTFIISWKMDIYQSAAICLAVGLLIGAWQGFWIAYVRIPAFIVTLAGMLVFRGLTLTLLNGLTIAPFPAAYLQYSTGFVPDFLQSLMPYGSKLNGVAVSTGVLVALVYCIVQVASYSSRRRKGYAGGKRTALVAKLAVTSIVVITLFTILAQYRGLPTVLILLGCLLLVYSFFTTSTVMGRHLYAIGGNEKAARLSGVKTNAMVFFAYVNMSFLAAVAGLVFAARLNSASPQAGQNFELDAIAACYIGGASAYGGIGTVGGALIGALIMGVLNNGMSIVGVTMSNQMIVKGLVLLLAVAFDVISKKQTALPAFRLPFIKRRRKQQSLEI